MADLSKGLIMCMECSEVKYNCLFKNNPNSKETCKICENIISYPTSLSLYGFINIKDLETCVTCTKPLLHVYHNGYFASYSLPGIHALIGAGDKSYSCDQIRVSSESKKGFKVFCDSCVMDFNRTHCGQEKCRICEWVKATPMPYFTNVDSSKVYNICHACKRFVEFKYTFPNENMTYTDFNIDNVHFIIKYKRYDVCKITSTNHVCYGDNTKTVRTVAIAKCTGPVYKR